MELSDVSKTAIVTLRSRVIESQKSDPILRDPMAEFCLNRLAAYASEGEKGLLFERPYDQRLTNHIAIRARKYDTVANDFIAQNSPCTVVNLGCGFDTRYWRINRDRCTYIELDLPEIVELKKEILRDALCYEIIPCSVLDPVWIDEVTQRGNQNFLLIAEGLLMYLPKADVVRLFKTIARKFTRSQIICEVVTEKYTRGFWKQIVIMKMKTELGFDSGSSYQFGIKNARELETYADGIKVIDEWAYVEDPDVKPRIFRYLGLSRTQWTVTAAINPGR